jgi:hypothetical protein
MAATAAFFITACGGGGTIGENIRAECEADYPNSPQAADNCTAEKEVAFISCRSAEKVYGVELQDTDCR